MDLIEQMISRMKQFREVKFAYLFGSRARSQARSESDWDIAVFISRELDREHKGKVERRLRGRLNALVPDRNVDLITLDEGAPLLCHRVLRDGRLLFSRDEDARIRFFVNVMARYGDSAVWRERFIRTTKKRLLAGTPDGRSRNFAEALERLGRIFDQT